jgi:hypothetical protein
MLIILRFVCVLCVGVLAACLVVQGILRSRSICKHHSQAPVSRSAERSGHTALGTKVCPETSIMPVIPGPQSAKFISDLVLRASGSAKQVSEGQLKTDYEVRAPVNYSAEKSVRG